MAWILPLVELNPRSSLQHTLADVGGVSGALRDPELKMTSANWLCCLGGSAWLNHVGAKDARRRYAAALGKKEQIGRAHV